MIPSVALLGAALGSLLFASSSIASPTTARFTLKDKVVQLPHGWVLESRAPPTYPLKLRIGLPQPNFSLLEDALYQVSDPTHDNYGQHLSKAQVDALVAPHPDAVSSVDAWLADHGLGRDSEVYSTNDAGDWVTLLGITVEQAEKMLDCVYHVFHHPETDERMVRTMAYGVPSHLVQHIDVIQPTTMFSKPRAARATFHFDSVVDNVELAKGLKTTNAGVVAPSCNSTITPACLKDLYGTTGYVPLTTTGNKLGIAGYLEEYANSADLDQFYAQFAPDAKGTSFEFVSVNGGLNNQSEPGGEANLDVQYGGAMSSPIPNVYYSTAGRPPFKPDILIGNDNSNEPYLEWLEYLLSHPNPPQVVTTSYDDNEQTVPKDYAIRVCNSFAQLGARGVSVLFSSGDGGVAGTQTPTACLTNDGKNTTRFLPTFPSSCPYVTSVGATHYINPEVGISFSSGGFSEYFDTPPYQIVAKTLFLAKLGNTHKGLFNPKGRGIPDVAAQGSHFSVILGGKLVSFGGTSASCPTFAGIVSLINDHLLRNKRPTLGFLNPWLYTLGQLGLNDIVGGSNPGCNTTGFTAVKGWDPITGLGTPDFKKLKTIAWPFGY